MTLPKLLRELKEKDFFILNDKSYRLLSFEMEGVRCEDSDAKIEYFSYLEVITVAVLPF
jgi:hypothetical protein